MVRKDTDRAIQGMQGKYIRGCELRLSLAKPVTIPPQVRMIINSNGSKYHHIFLDLKFADFQNHC